MTNTPEDPSNALRVSFAIQDAASAEGFDWPDVSGVIDKVREELGEVEAALAEQQREHAKSELGDLLFAAVNLARFLDADPAEELTRANARFETRYNQLKTIVEKQGRTIDACSLDELNVIWERVKRLQVAQKKRGLT